MSDRPFNLNYYGENVIDRIDAPIATAATDIEDDRFTAHWDEVADAVSYQLDVSESPGFGELVTLGGVPVELPAGTLEYRPTGLAPETTHYYRVRAVKETGTVSGNSNTIILETLELFTAQGGDLVTYDGEYSRHYFTTIGSADFEVLTGLRRVRRLIVGGGAQGGGVNGSGVSCGGGGGGGVLDLAEEDRDPMAPGIYPAVVGDGGDVAGALNVGEDGGDSSFDGDVAEGGGHGGSAGSSVGNGGSGGGAVNSSGANEQGGLGTPGQGNDGGDCPGGGGGGGAGGGGAAEAGSNGSIAGGGDGGDGLESDISGEAVRYGAGGSGARPVDPFGTLPATAAGLPGAGGGGQGANVTPAAGGDATGIGAGGGGALGNRAGGKGTKGTVVLKYKGRAADITEPPEEPVYRGPILFTGCTRAQVVDGVDILVDCNARIDSGIFPDYQKYICVGGGVVRSSRSYRASSLPSQIPDAGVLEQHGISNGTLVFRFSEPIRSFKITRKVTAGTDFIPVLVACDDYTVIPHPTSTIPGSSKDGAIVNPIKQSPELVHYPTDHYEPAVNLAAEEDMVLSHPDGFTCVVISQFTKYPSEFVDPMFVLLSD